MLIASLVAFAIQEQAAEFDPFRRGMIPTVERRLSKWKPGIVDQTTPSSAIWIKKADLTGKWSTEHYMDGSTLALTPTGPDTYSVEFTTAGCMAAWKLPRTATFRDGMLTFNKAVDEYAPATYDRVYTVRLNGKVR